MTQESCRKGTGRKPHDAACYHIHGSLRDIILQATEDLQGAPKK